LAQKEEMVMRLTGWIGISLGAVAMLAASLAFAQEEASRSDDVVMLPCDGQCVTVNRNPTKISGRVIRPPDNSNMQGPTATRIIQNNFPEGFVELQYTIKADGTVGDDVSVMRLVGPQSFVDAAKRTVRDWRYEPAMVDGHPVAITHQLRVYYGNGVEPGARSSIIKGYGEAGDLIKAGKLDEAHGKLTEMLAIPALNFYERGMIAYLLTLIAMERKDYEEAGRVSGLSLAFGDGLPRAIYQNLFRMNITASLYRGDIVGAAKTLGSFSKTRIYDPADSLAKLVADAKEKIDELPFYAMEGKIPSADEADGYGFFLYRRDFAFTKIAGALFDYTLSCHERQVDSPITDSAEWHVPKGWSDCFVWVRGRPGSTFQIVQFASTPAPKK
jgi:hypothetical protein